MRRFPFRKFRVRGPVRFIYWDEERPLLGNFSGHRTFICPHGLMFFKLKRQMGRSIPSFRPPAPPLLNTHTHTRTHPPHRVLEGNLLQVALVPAQARGLCLVCASTAASPLAPGDSSVSEAVFVNMSAILCHLYQ